MKLSDFEVLLLVDKTSNDAFPFSSHGFAIASGAIGKVRARTKDTIFLDAYGKIFRISDIATNKNSVVSYVKGIFGLPYPISIVKEPIRLSLEDAKNLVSSSVIQYKERYLEPDEAWGFVHLPHEKILADIAGCRTLTQLHAALNLPRPEDCLDLL